MTSPAVLSSSARLSLRLLSDRDSRVTPSKVGPSCGAIWSSVADNVSSDWFSDSVSVPAVFAVRSPTASVNEYGDDVREVGMTCLRIASCRYLPTPAPAPAHRAVSRSGCARWCPTRARTSRRSRSRPAHHRCPVKPLCTEPTLMPDTVTSLPMHQAAGLVEHRLIPHRRRPRHQPFRLQPDGDDEDGQDDADEAGLDEFGSAVLEHRAPRTFRSSCLTQGNTDGPALKVGGAERDSADVVLEEAAVGAQTRQLAVVAPAAAGSAASRRSLSLSSSGANRFSWSTVPASGGRASAEQVGQRRGAVVQ